MIQLTFNLITIKFTFLYFFHFPVFAFQNSFFVSIVVWRRLIFFFVFIVQFFLNITALFSDYLWLHSGFYKTVLRTLRFDSWIIVYYELNVTRDFCSWKIKTLRSKVSVFPECVLSVNCSKSRLQRFVSYMLYRFSMCSGVWRWHSLQEALRCSCQQRKNVINRN